MTRELELGYITDRSLGEKYGHDNVISAQGLLCGNPDRALQYQRGEMSVLEFMEGRPGELEETLERWWGKSDE